MAFTQVTITQDYTLADGTEPSGTVTFTPTAPMYNGSVVVPMTPAVARLAGGTGTITTTLVANTDPATTPAGVYYKVVETVNGVTRTFNVQIPHNLGSQLTLYSLTQVASPPGISFPNSGAVGALLAGNNLSDLASAAAARTNLGLHGAAVLDVGTTTGTVAAGDDPRFGVSSGALLTANNLSDLASAATARVNLGLHGAAVLNVGTTAGTVAAGDDPRFVGATNIVTPEQHGAVGNGSTNDQAALAASLAALQPGNTLLLTKIYCHNGVLDLNVDHVTIRGGGELRATAQTTSGFRVNADHVTIEDVTFRLYPVHSGRGNDTPHHKLTLNQCTGAVLRRVTIEDSYAAGIFCYGASDYLIESCVVRNTSADGIHSTNACTRGVIVAPRVTNTGDDGIAVASYTIDPAPCSDIMIRGARVVTTTTGRGISVDGGTDITYTDFYVESPAGAGVYVSTEAVDPGVVPETRSTSNIVIERGYVTNANTAAPAPDYGAILVSATAATSTISNVVIRDVTCHDTDTDASRVLGILTAAGSTMSGIVLEDIRITGTAPATTLSTTGTSAANYSVRRIYRGVADLGYELLGEAQIASAVTTGGITIAARDQLMIVIRTGGMNAGNYPALRFNADNGAHYWHRQITAAAGAATLVNNQAASATYARLSGVATGNPRTIVVHVQNNQGAEKVGVVSSSVGTGDATAPGAQDVSASFEWVNTTAQITSVELRTADGTTQFNGGTQIYVFGRNYT